MEPTLLEQIKISGIKKNHLAKLIGIKANHFYQCLSGNRQLSAKRQEILKNYLTTEAPLQA